MSEDYVQGTRHAVCDGARFQNAFDHKMVCGHFLCSGCWGQMHDSGRSLRCPACRFRYLETPEEKIHFITVVSGALARGGEEELKLVLPQFHGAPGEAPAPAAVVVVDTPEVSDSEGEEEPAGAFLGGQALRAPAHVSAATASRTTTVRPRRWPCRSMRRWRPAPLFPPPPWLGTPTWSHTGWRSPWSSSPWLATRTHCLERAAWSSRK
jgi:hypothetical protein